MSYFKDIYNQLCKRHPNKRIYVISDHHFFHNKIIDYERSEFSNLEEMHDHIIESHNKTVRPDDIVLFLGDFSFKKGEIPNILNKMNGHKYLLLGNHDNEDLIRSYGRLGFEGLFINPVKMHDKYFSHFPFYDKNIQNTNIDILRREFRKSNGTNYHGHVHGTDVGEKPYVNVCCEAQNYEPLLIGYTEGLLTSEKENLIINSEDFEKIICQLKEQKHIDPKILISDYLYTMMLEIIEKDRDKFYAYGSFPLYKKYGFSSIFSDLDIGVIYDFNLSKKKNVETLKRLSEEIHSSMVDIKDLNVSVEKRMPNICILNTLYSDKSGNYYNGYYDSNLVNDDIYRDSDFVTFSGTSFLEKKLKKDEHDLLNKYKFPSFEAKSLTVNGDMANIILQILFQKGYDEKKVILAKKLSHIFHYSNKDIDNIKDLEDIMIRFFIRNILFFYKANRSSEIEYYKEMANNIKFLIDHIPLNLYKQIIEIVVNPNSKFNKVYNFMLSLKFKDIPAKSEEVLKEIKKVKI